MRTLRISSSISSIEGSAGYFSRSTRRAAQNGSNGFMDENPLTSNGNPPSRTKAFAKILNAADMLTPIDSQRASIDFFVSSSNLILNVDCMMTSIVLILVSLLINFLTYSVRIHFALTSFARCTVCILMRIGDSAGSDADFLSETIHLLLSEHDTLPIKWENAPSKSNPEYAN